MKISLKKLFATAFGISVDEDGLDAEIRMHAFNVGYVLFLNKFDDIFPEKRLKTLKFTNQSGGVSIELLGTDINENAYDDFFHPFDVYRTDETESFYEPVDESINRFSSHHLSCVWDLNPVCSQRDMFVLYIAISLIKSGSESNEIK